MTTLHIVRQSAYATNDFTQCLQIVNKHDAIVFMDDGSYNVTHPAIKEVNDQVTTMAIIEHVNARAIDLTNTSTTAITMTQLVDLTFEADRVITWQ